MEDCIITHSTSGQPMAYRAMLAKLHAKSGLGPLPQDTKGEIQAYVNHGRWVAQCEGCLTGVVVEPKDPYFCCPACGRDGRRVIFPEDKEAIERILLRRPGFRGNAPYRNWELWESVEDLLKENIEHGVD